LHPKKISIGQKLTLIALAILCGLLLWEAYLQVVFFAHIVTDKTLGWRAAAGVFLRFILVLMLALGAGTGPFVFAYRQIFPSRKDWPKGSNAKGKDIA
jgi:hypothetical protein